jgi:hypothetical protein
MHAFTVHPQKTPAPAAKIEAKPRRRRRWLAIFLLLLGLAGLVWAVRPNSHLTRAKALQKELFNPDAKNLPPEQRKAKFDQLRGEMKQLTDEQKWALSAPMREKQQAEMKRYFALSQPEKNKYLDERIDRAVKMRQEREKNAGKAGGPGTGGQPGGGFGRGGADGPGGGASGPGGNPRSGETIEQRRKQFLDHTSPEDRAMMDQFRKEMADRRRQRGFPPRA